MIRGIKTSRNNTTVSKSNKIKTELLGYYYVKTTMIYTHIINRGAWVLSTLDE